MIRKIFILFSIIALGVSFSAQAQLGPDPSDLSVVVSPPSPGSFTNVIFRIDNFAVDLDAAETSWFVNGKEIQKGTGIRSFTTLTGAAGTPTIVRIVVKPQEGGTMEKVITLNPSDVDLLWRADTYTPAFYKGKALPSSESIVLVQATPQIRLKGSPVARENLIYKWSIGDKVQQTQSGFGKDRLIFSRALLNDASVIRVDISTVDGSITAQKIITIPEVSPEIHFYEEDPLEGTRYSLALDRGVRLDQEEGSVRAEPYYSSVNSLDLGALIPNWSIDGTPAEIDPSNPFVITLRKSEETTGVSRIQFSLAHKSKLLQNIKNSFNIIFGDE